MSCISITKGRKEQLCKTLGGIKAVYMGTFDSSIATQFGARLADAELTAAELDLTGETVYKFELRADGNSFEETNETSYENGTSIFTQTLTLALKKHSGESIQLMNQIAKGLHYAIIEDTNGIKRLAGMYRGLSGSAGSVTGGAFADFHGYNVTLTGTTTHLAPVMQDALFNELTISSDYATV